MKILIVRLGAIGDVIHTLPALAALRRTHPAAHLTWIVEAGASASLLAQNPYLDELIEIDNHKWRRSPGAIATRNQIRALVGKLRSEHYDVSLDFQGLIKSAVIPYLARIPRRLGFERRSLREPAAGLLLNERVAASDDDHIIRKNLKLAQALGCSPDLAYEFPVSTSVEDSDYIAGQLSQVGHRPAILNPGGGWPTKLWAVRRFAEIGKRLSKHFGIPSVITFGPGEEVLADEIVAECKNEPVTAVGTSLKQFLILAREARLFVGGDTGPMHLAAAAGTPIVALFGPTSSRRNGPFALEDIIVERDDLECRTDCYRRNCEHTSCMDLPTEVVWRAIVERLSKDSAEVVNMLRQSPQWWHSVETDLIEE
jgi:heptosyltransferase I